MIRFLSFLFNKPYETCKSCETLKQQLAYSQTEKRELLDTLLSIMKPKTFEASPTELANTTPIALTFGRRRAALENKDREEARILAQTRNMGKPDSDIRQKTSADIAALETELGIENEA